MHERRERRFLGSFGIPFSTVYENQRVEGSFRVNVPFSLLGYSRSVVRLHATCLELPTPLQATASSHESLHELGSAAASSTYLTIFVTLDPPLRQA